MKTTILLTCVLLLSTALNAAAQQRPKRQARRDIQASRVPAGVRAQRNIAYVVNGHERHVNIALLVSSFTLLTGILLHTQPTDMRKSFDGLSGIDGTHHS